MIAVQAEEMRRLDASAIHDVKIPGLVLMENAGREVVQAMEERAGRLGLGHRIVVLCGPGNNGGDGFVVARHLWNRGCHVSIVATRDPNQLEGDAWTNAHIAGNMGIPVHVVSREEECQRARAGMQASGIIVDALLGTGSDRPLDGVIRELVSAANDADALRIAVDLPTGIHSDTGEVPGEAFRASLTVTLGVPKLGLYLWPACSFAGEIRVADISLPRSLVDSARGIEVLDHEWRMPFSLARRADSHKGTMGHLLVVAGSPGRSGAALLAGLAALRTGTGLCTLAVHPELGGSLEGRVPDLMVRHQPSSLSGWRELLEGKTAVVAGPGMGTDAFARQALHQLLEAAEVPTVLDADALTLVALEPDLLTDTRAPMVLTPHPGEMGRLLGLSVSEVQSNRIDLARSAAARWGQTVILKGFGTLIAGADGTMALNRTGTPALAKAGTGDVLSGLIGALLSRRIPVFDAARAGVWLHGRAGEAAESVRGENGVLASDVIEQIHTVMAS